jgi:hypothetical protein
MRLINPILKSGVKKQPLQKAICKYHTNVDTYLLVNSNQQDINYSAVGLFSGSLSSIPVSRFLRS